MRKKKVAILSKTKSDVIDNISFKNIIHVVHKGSIPLVNKF